MDIQLTSPDVDPDMTNLCRATWEPANGEHVTDCHREKGHEGGHEGWCLGSLCSWPQGYSSEYEWVFFSPGRMEKVEPHQEAEWEALAKGVGEDDTVDEQDLVNQMMVALELRPAHLVDVWEERLLRERACEAQKASDRPNGVRPPGRFKTWISSLLQKLKFR